MKQERHWWRGNKQHLLRTGLFEDEKILSAVKNVEFYGDKLSFVLLRGQLLWYYCSESSRSNERSTSWLKVQILQEISEGVQTFLLVL